MKNIEIITTQNVVLQYELATLKDRALAFFIDSLCIVFTYFVFVGILVAIVGGDETSATIIVLFVGGSFCFYTLLFETLNHGQTIGKMALRIRVMKVAGGKIAFSDYAARWAFRLIDIFFSFGTIASILVVSSGKGQRIGDVVANTAVVKTAPRMNLTLDGLLNLHQKNSTYTPRFPQSRKLHEEDALLIKSTLDRYRKYENESHEEAVGMLSRRIKELLLIESTDPDDRFLQSVLQDYIVLSR